MIRGQQFWGVWGQKEMNAKPDGSSRPQGFEGTDWTLEQNVHGDQVVHSTTTAQLYVDASVATFPRLWGFRLQAQLLHSSSQ